LDSIVLKQFFSLLPDQDFDDLLKLVHQVEAFDNLFSGFIQGNNSANHKFRYIDPRVEQITGYPPGRFMEEDGTAFFYSKTPDVFLPYIFERVGFYNSEPKLPDFNSKNPQLIDIDAGLVHAQGHIIKMRCFAIVLEYTTKNEIFLMFSTWQDTTNISREELNSITLELSRLFTLIKLNYIQAHPEKFIVSCASDNELIKLIYPLYKGPVVTKSESKILKLIASGFSSKEIAEKLYISFHTAETHRKNLLEKFEARNSAELVKKAGKIYWLP
jgi:DNA-binding CsgD family transcriptional regulator